VVSAGLRLRGVGFPVLGMSAFAYEWSAILRCAGIWRAARSGGARLAALGLRARVRGADSAHAPLRLLAFLRLRSLTKTAPQPGSRAAASAAAAPRGVGGAFAAEWRRVLALRGPSSCWCSRRCLGIYYPQPYLNQICARSRSRSSTATRANSAAGSCRCWMRAVRSRWRCAPNACRRAFRS